MSNIQMRLQFVKKAGEQTAEAVTSTINSGFSGVTGLDQLGTIHERALETDAGSARNSLTAFAGQVAWLAEALQSEMEAFGEQEDSNKRGLDIADAGGAVGMESMPVVAQPEPGYVPFSFVPPVVNVGMDLGALANELMFTNIWRLHETKTRWQMLKGEVQRMVEGLESSASSISGANDSIAMDNAAGKMREVARTGNQFMANADAMSEKLVTMHVNLMHSQSQAMALFAKTLVIPDPIAKKAAETAALTYMQGLLQTQVNAAIPNLNPLMEPQAATGGGQSIDAGLGDVAGTGTRYNTEEVIWPKAIAEAMARGELGPGSFHVADGKIQAVEGIDRQSLNEVRQVAEREGARVLKDLGIAEPTAINPGELATRGASVGPQAPSALASVAPTHVAPGGAGVGAPGVGSYAPGAMGSLAPANATPGGQAMLPAGIGAAGSPVLGAGATPMGAQRGVAPGGAPGASASGAGVGGATRTGAGRFGDGRISEGRALGDGVRRAGVGGAPVPAANTRAGLAGGSAPVGGNAVAATRAAAAGGAAGGQRAGATGRGMVPLMPGRRGDGRKETGIKAVTTQVERDPNRRDLLGEAPAVVPGVIGEWARESN